MTEILELDSKRVLRAQDYVAVPLAKGQYRIMATGVEAQRDPYYYYVQIEPQLICYCSDATYRNVVCKHIIAALYEAGDPRLGTGRSVLSRAHAARGRLPYSIQEVPDEPYPDELSLEEALARHASDERIAQSRRLSGRIITDPGADLEALRQVAHRCSRQSIRAALLRIPVAAADKEIRSALMGEGTTALIIGRLFADRRQRGIPHALSQADRARRNKDGPQDRRGIRESGDSGAGADRSGRVLEIIGPE